MKQRSLPKRIKLSDRILGEKPLILDIEDFQDTEAGNLLNATISLPSTNTPYMNELRELHHQNLANLELAKQPRFLYQSNKPSRDKALKVLKGEKPGLFLEGFYVGERMGQKALRQKNPILKDVRNAEEKKALSGLGKEMLCTVLAEVITNYPELVEEDTWFALTAAGGRCPSGGTLPETKDYTREQALKLMEDRNYRVLMKSLDKMSKEELLFELCRIEDNLKLVNYYRDTYGLEQFGQPGSSVLMGAPLSTVLKRCTSKHR